MTKKQQILKEFGERFECSCIIDLQKNDILDDNEADNAIKQFLSSKIDLIEKEAREQALKEVRDEIKEHKFSNTYDGEESKVFQTTIEEIEAILDIKLNQLK